MAPSSEYVFGFVAIRDPQRSVPPGTLWVPAYNPAAPTEFHQAPRIVHGIAARGAITDRDISADSQQHQFVAAFQDAPEVLCVLDRELIRSLDRHGRLVGITHGKVPSSGRLRGAGQPLLASDARGRAQATDNGRRQIRQAGAQRAQGQQDRRIGQVCADHKPSGHTEFPGLVREHIHRPELQARVARHHARAPVPAVPTGSSSPRSPPAAGPATVITVRHKSELPRNPWTSRTTSCGSCGCNRLRIWAATCSPERRGTGVPFQPWAVRENRTTDPDDDQRMR